MTCMTIRNRVKPFAMPKVRDLHYPGIFGDFGDIVDAYIVELEKQDKFVNQKKIDFFRFMRKEIHPDDYGEIQCTYATEEHALYGDGRLKYLDPIHWFDAKFNGALRIGLDRAEPLDILDIGTGCGQFPFIAQYFGHSVLGTDVRLCPGAPSLKRHMYDAFCEMLNVTKVEDRIHPYQAVSDFGQRFDLVTAFMAAFNVMKDKSPWPVDVWKFFFASLQETVLKPNGRIYFQLTDGKLTGESWAYLKSHAVWSNDESKVIYIEDINAYL